jgi:hypothetical protein
MNRQQAIDFLKYNPVKYAKMLGFDKLGTLHNDWIMDMVWGQGDRTLQSHRGGFKTTCVSVALAEIIILLPRFRTMFMRKTDNDVKEIVKQVQNILANPRTLYLVQCIYGVNLQLQTQSVTEINTNLTNDVKGTSQLLGIGLGSSITGKHYDRIFTDDIVNMKDRTSRAEREKTKLAYQELQNIKNKGQYCRIYNTGTPWHKDDAFTLMPPPQKYDCYSTGILSKEEIEELRGKLTSSLFAANYELRHIASDDVIFTEPVVNGDAAMIEQGIMQLDSAFYGEDYTAWSIMKRAGGKYYLFGRMRRKHVEDCYDLIKEDYERFMCGKLYNESNADKGMVGKDLRKLGIKVVLYHENMNKHVKIVTYLKAIWKDVIFVEGTDREYIDQICDYFEDAEHDDAPDSAASLARILYKKGDTEYKSVMGLI